jgi:hypothetical protein
MFEEIYNYFLAWYCNWKHISHGTYTGFFANDQKFNYTMYKGKLHGKHLVWFINGQLKSDFNFSNDKTHGQCEEWYESGKKYFECNFFEGKPHGQCNKWDQQGKLIKSEDYVFGYNKTHLWIILRTLRKAKWIRLAKLTKTKSFNEWWYSPYNPGGKIAKKKLNIFTRQ